MNRQSLRFGVAILLTALLCGLSFEIDVVAKKKPKRRRVVRSAASQRQRIVIPAAIAMPRAATSVQSITPMPNWIGPTPKSTVTTTPKSAVTTTPKSTVKAPTLSGPNPSAAAGDLDTSFSGDGRQTKDVTTVDDRALAVAVQADGKIVVAGSCNGTPGSPGTNSNNFMVARFNTDGSLDDGSGTDSTPGDGGFGVFVTDFFGNSDVAQAIAIQTDGKIIVGGFATDGGSGTKDFALIRLTTTGAPDLGFGINGKVTTSISANANDEIFGIAIQSDGRIVAAGQAFGTVSMGQDFAIARYNTNGSLDDNSGSDSTPGDFYGTAGKTLTDFATSGDIGYALALQTDGKAVVAGRAFGPGLGGFNFALARYTTAGLLDTSFGATDTDGVNGVTMTDFNASSDENAFAVAIQTDGKIIAGGRHFSTSDQFALARYNTNGSLDDGTVNDTTPLDAFDSDGKRLDDMDVGPDTVYALAVQSDGKIVAAGSSSSDSMGNDSFKDFRIARYESNGGLESSFGTGGSTATDFAGAQDEIFALALQTDGKMVAAGVAQEPLAGQTNIGLARYDGAAPPTATAGQLIISEFRLRGPGGANDEFIEIYNASGANHTVSASGGTGYGIAASDGTTRCTIPNGQVIPNRAHYLCVNSGGYSLIAYPGDIGNTFADASYTTDIPDNAGIALFNNNTGGVDYNFANRLDAVGSTSEANTVYREGAGLIPVATGTLEYAWVRDTCGKSGSVTTMGLCSRSTPKDTDDNASDFFFVDTAATVTAAGQRLGAPGPENLSSPIQRNSSFSATVLDPCVADSAFPNRERISTSDPGNNSTFGTLDIRRTVTNNTGAPVARLRWRIIDISTAAAPGGIADLRARTSTDLSVTVDRAPCGSGTSSITVRGTTLETPPAQGSGGGFNSSLSSGTITLATPLANGASIDVRFLLGVQQTGNFKIYLNIEALP